MIDKIRGLEEKIAASRMDTVSFKNPEPSKFILQIPGITENYKQHLDFGKVKTLSNRSSLKYKRRILKSQERVDLINKMVEIRERYPVRNYADMRKTIDLLQQQFLTNSLYACSHILTSDDEGMELYKTWNDGWEKLSETDKDAQDAKLQSSIILEEILRTRDILEEQPSTCVANPTCSYESTGGFAGCVRATHCEGALSSGYP
jgi:hypothetical protein